MGGIQGLINHKQIREEQFNYTKEHGKRLDCTWNIQVEPQYKVS
jgi:hypothetical protein